jgi:HupE / UreJ protein
MTRLLAVVVALLAAAPAAAHVTNTSYLTIQVGPHELQGEWEIARRDLEYLLRPASGTPAAPIGDEAMAAYALPRLRLRADGRAVACAPAEHSLSTRDGLSYVILGFTAALPADVKSLEIEYGLFRDDDPNHRAFFSVTAAGATHSGVFDKGHALERLVLAEPSLLRAFAEFFRQGVWHIWTGFDHVLFLIALLLPSVLVREGTAWRVAESPRLVFADVVKVVTAFTLAHSVTLSLATLRIVNLPSRFVESAIAASVLWAALSNLRPSLRGTAWKAAFGFGLLHGFGFAGALLELGLPPAQLRVGLLAFNLGVEAGQLAIVAAFIPLAFAARARWWYPTLVLRMGSLGIAGIAAVWLGMRLFS